MRENVKRRRDTVRALTDALYEYLALDIPTDAQMEKAEETPVTRRPFRIRDHQLMIFTERSKR